MAYQQATIHVASLDAEPLSEALINHGALSAAIQDAFAGTEKEQPIFGEPGEPVDALWRESLVIVLFNEQANVSEILQAVSNETGLPGLTISSLEIIPEQDWVRLTQAQFDPIQISDRLWITPTWHEIPDREAINLQLDPGLAFGTGSHPTTRLCLEWLDKNLKAGSTILDYGCGSGILAIAALKLGASSAIGVDIDPQAIQASKDNATQNQVFAEFYLPEQAPDGQFDIVLANILANPLRMLGEMLAQRTKAGGIIVLSGILQEQAEELLEIYRQWFEMGLPIFLEGWSCLSGVRNNH